GIRDRNVTGVQTCALPISAMLQISKFFVPIGPSVQNPPLQVVKRLNALWGEVVVDLNKMIITITNGMNNGPKPTTPRTTTIKGRSEERTAGNASKVRQAAR